MANPKNATTGRGGKRTYSWRGESYFSVTTLIDGGLPKRALIYWAANEVARYAVDSYAKLAPFIEEDPDAAYQLLKGSPWRKKEKAADLGSAVHDAIEAYVLGKPRPPWPDAIAPRMRQFERFLKDYEPEYLLTEASVYNRTERYAGTLDAIVKVNGLTLVIDQKTGKALYPEVGLQLAAYRFAEFIGLPDGSEGRMPKTDGAAGLHLMDDDYEFLDVQADEQVFRAFKYVREVFRFQEQIAKGVIGGPVQLPREPQQVEIDLAKAVGE